MVYAEAYVWYVAGENPRRTQFSGKMAICGWTLINETTPYTPPYKYKTNALRHPIQEV